MALNQRIKRPPFMNHLGYINDNVENYKIISVHLACSFPTKMHSTFKMTC